MEIINRISYLLAGREQRELTDYLGLKSAAFSEWKSGKSKSYRKYLIEIAEFFDVSIDYLVYGKKNACSSTTIHIDELEQTKIKSIDAKEQRLLNAFRLLPLEEQFCFIGKIEQAAESYNSAENVG